MQKKDIKKLNGKMIDMELIDTIEAMKEVEYVEHKLTESNKNVWEITLNDNKKVTVYTK